ncbi:MAG TPA: LytTR family DNA-binding domain-containing protein [Brevundimonas sp.]|nr:LytTR family DNA-binding domain-containing protein [Brevundimonas sp.]
MTTVCAAWFLRRGSDGDLGLAESLRWQGAVYGLWLPVAALVWLLLRRFGAGPLAFAALSVAGFLIAPLHSLAARSIDLAFGAGGAGLLDGAIARAPVSMLIYTAICAVGAAAAHRSRAVEARMHARSLESALARAREVARAPDALPERLMVMIGNRRAPVLMDEVEWFAAAGNYVVVHWADREGLMREPLKILEARLDGRVFARSHRSTVVNLARVRDARSLSDGSWRLTMQSGAELVASRTYRDALMARLGRQGSSAS